MNRSPETYLIQLTDVHVLIEVAARLIRFTGIVYTSSRANASHVEGVSTRNEILDLHPVRIAVQNLACRNHNARDYVV